MKMCSKCGLSQDLEEFALKNPKKDTRVAWCRSCKNLYNKQHYKENSDSYKVKARAFEVLHGGSGQAYRHHTTLEHIEKMKARYHGRCWVCQKKPAVVIDHDHRCCPTREKSCGKCIRGVLCVACNTGLGKLGDSVESLRRAVSYLELPFQES